MLENDSETVGLLLLCVCYSTVMGHKEYVMCSYRIKEKGWKIKSGLSKKFPFRLVGMILAVIRRFLLEQ